MEIKWKKGLMGLIVLGRSSRADCADHPRQIDQICRSGSPNKSADTLFAPVSTSQGPQEAHGQHLLVPGSGVVGGTYQSIKKSSSGSPNESADTPYAPVSAPQGLQEAHGLHLLVPGAGVVGGISQPIKILHLGFPTNLLIPHFPL